MPVCDKVRLSVVFVGPRPAARQGVSLTPCKEKNTAGPVWRVHVVVAAFPTLVPSVYSHDAVRRNYSTTALHAERNLRRFFLCEFLPLTLWLLLLPLFVAAAAAAGLGHVV